MPGRITIVIPVRNDAVALARTLDHLETTGITREIEIIVAASGDPEGTAAAVRNRAQLLWPGVSTRAALMNAGAMAANGDVLFFLHADSLPPPAAVMLIEQALGDERVVGGAFEHLFDEPGWSLRAITYINRVRYRLTHNYYGDQGMFVRADIFRRLGGFKDWALMEDIDLSQRMKRLGRTVLIPVPLRTSGRRFIARGPWRTCFFAARVLFCYMLGLDTQRYAEHWRGPADQTPGSPPVTRNAGRRPSQVPLEKRPRS